MCLLTFFPEGIQPDVNGLINGAFYNDDGHGFAIVVNGRIVVRKSEDAPKLIDEFVALREKHPEGPAMFHSRFTTDGINGKYNMHPFEVTGYKRTVMAHNGVMPQEARPKKSDIRSDTRIVAEKIIPKHRFDLTSRRGRRRFGRWMGAHNKVAVITLDPRFARPWYIVNESSGSWVDGMWYSNDGYLPRTFNVNTMKYLSAADEYWDKEYVYDPVSATYRPMGDREYRDWWHNAVRDNSDRDDCTLCSSLMSVDPVTMFCQMCQSCQDCTEEWDNCMCYVPSMPKESSIIGQKAIEAIARSEQTMERVIEDLKDGKTRLERALETIPDAPRIDTGVGGGWDLD